jgi:predicted metal-dependent HD superfamily phosphohydrolase
MPTSASERVIEALRVRYREPQRHYHTLEHVDELLTLFAAERARAQRPDHIEWAIWFHDAIYDPQRSDNEARSAALARASLIDAGLARADISAVVALISATADHQWRDGQPDTALFLDLDLSILGAAPDRYDAYVRQVRAEYAFVPEPVFRRKRAELLSAWLSRPALYFTEFARARFEPQARQNLARELAIEKPPRSD